ncbi:long-chain fatty acid--CoA ligase [Persicimonas caeni]|uniref:Long-chain fatty acid--CoA ligase n=1 Tax=Persicimonas caeni TaxID=2292766 RepID=A0A4Y6PVS5_PERCE|nr:long-chain fatty acid--CoA ligase [Persicimonas caeni]QDG52432.1 long-chain fatty acid--CoA ligase [Persicimonas caeni]QED33654.1 long-chain fatty acid--CoA ligase [Persicimonas caeni]
MARDSIVDRFLDNSEKHAGKPAAWANLDGKWKYINWANYAKKCRLFAGGLVARGIEPHQHITIIGNNCPEWVMADMGAMMARCVPVGIYQTNSPSEVAYIADHCESKVMVLEDKEQWEKVDKARDEMPNLEHLVMIRDADQVDDEMVVSFDDFLESGREHLDDVDERISGIEMDEVATMIYTSGTTSKPKGVMLTHDNLAFTAGSAQKMIGGMEPDDCLVSYLPLSHIAEQMFTIHLAATFGYPIWFCDDIAKVKETIEVARPTVFFGVPRVWEKFKSALENKLAEATGAKAKLVDWARGVGVKAAYQQIEHGDVRGALKIQYALANKLVFSKLKGKLGFDRLRMAVSAAAPIGLDVLEFFASFDIIIREIYGQSEDTGPTTANRPMPGQTKLGTVGLPIPDVDVKIAEDGEILVKGRNVFKGYYKNEDATNETLTDGWLHSGDIGQFDKDGFLRITGRKKEIIITAGGKNIAPAKIESLLKKIDGIGQAVVIGDRRKFLSALLTIDAERGPAMAEEKGWPTDPDELVDHPEFREYIDREVEAANNELARVSTVKKWVVLPQDFSQETDELTPTQKIKRRVVESKYADEIEGMYSGGKAAE